jgi:hypothetical protein
LVETVVSEASSHVKVPQTRLTYRRWGITHYHGPVPNVASITPLNILGQQVIPAVDEL